MVKDIELKTKSKEKDVYIYIEGLLSNRILVLYSLPKHFLI